MLILGIETCLPSGLVFLGKEEGVLVSCNLPAHSSSRYLVPAVESVLREVNLSIDKIDALVVSKGPGSFTGLRVGISLAKSLSFSLELPLVGVATLDYIASCVPFNGFICCLIPAYRNCFFSAFFYKEGEDLTRRSDYLFLPFEKIIDEAKKLLPEKVVFVFFPENFSLPGNLDSRFSLFKEKICLDRALLKWALRDVRNGKIIDPLALVPVYVSPPLINIINKSRK